MSSRLSNWIATWRPDDTIPYAGGCQICTSPCDKPGWVQIEAISAGFCRHCIEYLVLAAPEVARAALGSVNATTTTTRENTHE